MRFVPCDTLTNDTSAKIYTREERFNEVYKKSILCPDLRELKDKFIAGKNRKLGLEFSPRLAIYPCSLPNKTRCAPSKDLLGAKLLFYSTSKSFNSSNKKEPVAWSTRIRMIGVDPRLRKTKKFDVKLNRIEDETYFFSQPKLKEEYVTLHESDADVMMRPGNQIHCSEREVLKGVTGRCHEYASLNYKASDEVLKIRRSYPKLTSVLGELGGFLKLVSTVVFFFYSFYNGWSLRGEISRRLYEVKSLFLSKDQRRGEKSRRGSYHLGEGSNKIHQSQVKGKHKGDCKRPYEAGIQVENYLGVDQKEYKQVMRECVNSRTSAIDLMRKLDFVEVLQKLLFESHHHALLPLLVLKLRKKQMERAIDQKRQKDSYLKFYDRFSQRKVEENQQRSSFPQKREFLTKNSNSEMSYQEAYQSLQESSPRTKIKQAIKELMLENLSEFFESRKSPKQRPQTVQTPSQIIFQRSKPKTQKKNNNKPQESDRQNIWNDSEQGGLESLHSNTSFIRDSEPSDRREWGINLTNNCSKKLKIRRKKQNHQLVKIKEKGHIEQQVSSRNLVGGPAPQKPRFIEFEQEAPRQEVLVSFGNTFNQ